VLLGAQRASELTHELSDRIHSSRAFLVTCVTVYELGSLLFSVPRQDALSIPNRADQTFGSKHHRHIATALNGETQES
jgi:hypothetical protein